MVPLRWPEIQRQRHHGATRRATFAGNDGLVFPAEDIWEPAGTQKQPAPRTTAVQPRPDRLREQWFRPAGETLELVSRRRWVVWIAADQTREGHHDHRPTTGPQAGRAVLEQPACCRPSRHHPSWQPTLPQELRHSQQLPVRRAHHHLACHRPCRPCRPCLRPCRHHRHQNHPRSIQNQPPIGRAWPSRFLPTLSSGAQLPSATCTAARCPGPPAPRLR